MRYTEARLSPFGELMLEDVDKLALTKPNFDESGTEPIDLASYFPNLLCNPSNGIAVGLATKFAPHYAADIYNAIIYILDQYIEEKEIDFNMLMRCVPAPDFPTGGIIINGSEMPEMYRTGNGAVTIRARYKIDKDNIIYTEIPYKVKPNDIIKSIVELNIPDIKDVRNETNLKDGLRIVVELKKGSSVDWVVNKLFKDTPLQTNYSVNMVAIVNGKPETNLSLERLLTYYIDNIIDVHSRHLQIKKSEITDKIFTVNTMLKAIANIDEIISIIKKSDDPINDMMEKLNLNEEEANYIYKLKLSSLSKASKNELDIKKAEYEESLKQINSLLNNKKLFLQDLVKKFDSIRTSKIFKNDTRRTTVVDVKKQNSLDVCDFIKNESVIVSYSNKGMLKATRPNEYKTNRRKAMGVKTKALREDEFIYNTLTTTHSNLLLFSDLGRCYLLPVHKIPINGKNGAFKSINNFINMDDNEHILSIVSATNDMIDQTVVMVTKKGMIKRIPIELLLKSRVSTVGTRAIVLAEGDKICSTSICKKNADMVIFTSSGKGLKINIDDESKPIKVSGKTSKGLLAIKLKNDEVVVNASVVDQDHSVVLVTSEGFGKRLDFKTFKSQKRYQTPINYMAKDKVGKIVACVIANDLDDLLITTKEGQVLRVAIKELKPLGRTSLGLKLINIKSNNDTVVSAAAIKNDEEEESIEL